MININLLTIEYIHEFIITDFSNIFNNDIMLDKSLFSFFDYDVEKFRSQNYHRFLFSCCGHIFEYYIHTNINKIVDFTFNYPSYTEHTKLVDLFFRYKLEKIIQ